MQILVAIFYGFGIIMTNERMVLEMATLDFRYAVMNAGKTNQLLALAQSLIDCGETPLMLSSAKDNRFGEGVIASRSGWKMNCTDICDSEDLFQLISIFLKDGRSIKYIIIDEIQFFTVEQIEDLSKIVDILNINVVAFGLNVNSNGNLFDASKRMFELADDYSRTGVKHCHCGKKATMILRFNPVDLKIIKNAETILVGSEDCYESVCRSCWAKNQLSPRTIGDKK